MSRPAARTPWFPFLVVAAALSLVAVQAAVPTPLYPLYADRWELPSVATSAVFSVYIATLALTLLVAGSLSDHVGRRPVGIAALLFVVAGVVVLASAQGLGGLLLGRSLQGIASGLGFGTLAAAMLDHSPPHRHGLVSVVNGAMPPLSQGVGAVVSGVLVQFGPHPQQFTYLLVAVLVALVAVGLFLIPERAVTVPATWRTFLPVLACPPSVRREFAVAAGALCASWAVLGLYLGIGPTVARDLFGVDAPSISGLLVLAVTGAGALVGALTFSLPPLRVMKGGASALVAGALLMGAAATTGSFLLFAAATLVGGAGFGGAFQGGLSVLLASIAPHERGTTISLLYLVAYAAFGLPVLVAGWAAAHVSLPTVVQGYAVLVVLLATGALLAARRTRSVPAPAEVPVATV